jgi:UDP-glucose 4-epimerase
VRKVLVTGGWGYLGGRIGAHLLSLGFEVAGGTRSPVRAAQQGSVLTDFEDPGSLTAAFEGFDVVVHLAGMNEIDAAANPEAAMHTTAIFTLRAVRAAEAARVQRFIYFSTVHVYGAPLSGLLSEEAPTHSAHPYAISHRAAEDFVFEAHHKGVLSCVIFRLSNGYGYPVRPEVDRWSLLVNDLCRQAATSGKIVLRSSGVQSRDFIPLCDVAGAVAHVIDLPPAADPTYNLGSGSSLAVLGMARYVAERYEALTGKSAVLEAPPVKPGEGQTAFRLSVEKLKSTGFAARSLVSDEIDESIRRCMTWFSGSNS